MASPLTVALHPAVAPNAPEVKYVFRTLLRLAGFSYRFVWAGDGPADIYYGPAGEPSAAQVQIPFAGLPFANPAAAEPQALREQGGLPLLEFPGETASLIRLPGGELRFTSDIVFTCYWLLTGAREPSYRRDKRDNFHLDRTSLQTQALLERPLVSLYAAFLRRHFAGLGREPEPLPWTNAQAQGALALTHDVDYPDMIRWVECLRVLAGQSHARVRALPGVLRGSNHFWKFSEWIELAHRFDARPAFYFSARQGSLAQYAKGTPDCFYDVHSPRFQKLLRFLQEQGCEVGLHASYHAFQSAERLRQEKESLERAAGTAVAGGRHHYWRLNPAAPHETLARHEQIGMRYDSSLAFEFYPGFRRGVCHPFRPYHPGERRELGIVELPPAWMDDHFDRRLSENGIADPRAPEPEVRQRTMAWAARLLDAVRTSGGVAVLDYHARGMNADFFPRYGPWLTAFLEQHAGSSLTFTTPAQLAAQYGEYQRRLSALSDDRAQVAAESISHRTEFEVSRMRPEEVAGLARMHYEFFGMGEMHGTSIANFGLKFLEQVFYRLNLDNPYLFVDIARYRGQIVGFSVYASDGKRVFRETLRRHLFQVLGELARVGLRAPRTLITHVVGNLAFFREQAPEVIRGIRGWYFLLGVKAEFRNREFRERTGIWIAGELWQHMEKTLREQGCDQFWTVVGAHNRPMNTLHQLQHMELVATGMVQGLPSNYYRKSLAAAAPAK